MTEYDRALRLLASCQMPGFDHEATEVYPAREDGVDSVANGLAAAQTLASLAIAVELKRMNEGRDSFHREVLEVLTRSSEGPFGAGATAQVVERCETCGALGDDCLRGKITASQWDLHLSYWQDLATVAQRDGSYAEDQTVWRHGVRPDEPAGPSQQEGEDR